MMYWEHQLYGYSGCIFTKSFENKKDSHPFKNSIYK